MILNDLLKNTRTPLDCMRHGIHRSQHAWTPESDDALLNAISIYGTDNWILGKFRLKSILRTINLILCVSRESCLGRCNSPAMSKSV
jgi:hypothetical protein